MRYVNISDDTRIVPSLGLIVAPGDLTPELGPAEAKGFYGQTEVWQPEKRRATKKTAANAAPRKRAPRKPRTPAADAPTTDVASSGDDDPKENG